MNKVCGDKPNCVSSFETRKDFSIAPLKNINGSWDDVKSQILKILKEMGMNEIHKSDKNFLQAIFTTKFMRFKDDVYFWWDPDLKELHMKSEARTGYWDIGANRKRLNTFSAKWSHYSK